MTTVSDAAPDANGVKPLTIAELYRWAKSPEAVAQFEQELAEAQEKAKAKRRKQMEEGKDNFLTVFCSVLGMERVEKMHQIQLNREQVLILHALYDNAYWYETFKYWYERGELGEPVRIPAVEIEAKRAEWQQKAEEDARAELAEELLQKKLANHEAEVEFQKRVAIASWRAPDADEDTENVGSLYDQLVRERPQLPQLIDGLAGRVHNVSITAPYKTGKTTFGINVMRAMVDETEFLGRATHLPAGGNVGWWNGEMDIEDWLDYARPVDPENGDRIFPLHLRGRSMPILSDVAAEWTIKWLKDNNIKVWWLDSWRVLCAWNGINENDNTGGGQLTARIDEIKTAAGVDAFFVLAHTGRAQQVEGEERSRGMTALDDWVDARWVLTKQQDRRFFAASGRNIKWGGTGTALVFDQETNLITLGQGDRRSGRDAVVNTFLYDLLTQRGPLNTTAVKQALHASGIDGMTNTDAKTAAISGASLASVIVGEKSGTANIYRAGRDPRGPETAISGGMAWVNRFDQN